jgi:hypothetical protein
MMTPAQMDDAYAALVTADGDQDAEALAVLCWQLYAELATTRARASALQSRFSAIARVLEGSPQPPDAAVVAEPQPAGMSA